MLVLTNVTYGFLYSKQSKATMNALERLQTKPLKWILGNKQKYYTNNLRLLNVFPMQKVCAYERPATRFIAY